jgi:hypothetical protein
MTKRPIPTTDEMMTIFTSSPGVYPFGMHSDRVQALTWESAIFLIRNRLNTTYKKAAEWILERGTEDDSPFVVLRAQRGLVARSDDGEYHGTAVPDGWTDQDCYDVRFDRYGRPALTGSKAGQRYTGNLVLLRSMLPALLAASRAARAAKNAELKAEGDATRREFYGHHGESMGVIEKWLAGLDRSGIDEALRDQEPFRVSTGRESSKKLWGSPPGNLTIELHGSEIAAFAELIERTRKGEV